MLAATSARRGLTGSGDPERVSREDDEMAVARKREASRDGAREKRNLFRGLVRDEDSKGAEPFLDVDPGLRAREEIGRLVDFRNLLQVRLIEGALLFEVGLVREELDGDLACDLVHGGDPVVQLPEGVLARDVAHGEDALRPVKVRLLEELPEALLA